MNNKNPYQRWFVFDYYCAAGRPKMEDALMEWARKQWLYCSVYETSLKDMVLRLKEKQDQLYEENKRLKKIDIRLCKNGVYDNMITIAIGAQSLRLREIREELEYV